MRRRHQRSLMLMLALAAINIVTLLLFMPIAWPPAATAAATAAAALRGGVRDGGRIRGAVGWRGSGLAGLAEGRL